MSKKDPFIRHPGWIEVICGPMYAGKSTELLRMLERYKYADVEYRVFSPKRLTRTYGEVTSRNGAHAPAIEAVKPSDILDYLSQDGNENVRVIAIDECQFFDDSLVDVVNLIADTGRVVICAGLDNDFRRIPFGPIPKLLAIAENVTKLKAVCVICGADANCTQRLIDGKPGKYNDPIVLVGDTEQYQARCRHHHQIVDKPLNEIETNYLEKFKR